MQPEITLTIYDGETGLEQRVRVDSRRFTIGRLPENDLAIEDSDLSRRHAVIESFEGSVLISDCGSQNGTRVNGQSVASAFELHDGDVITLGGAKEITIEMRQDLLDGTNGAGDALSTPTHPATQAPLKNPIQTAHKNSSFLGSAPPWLNAPVIAGAAAALILLGTGLLLALNGGSSAPPRTPGPSLADNQSSPTASERATPPADNDESPKKVNASFPGDSDELKIVEKNARIVMSSISNDSSPFLPSDVVSQISEKVKKYGGSSILRDQLRVMKQRGIPELAAPAKNNDIKVALVVLAALAKMDQDGERSDPVTVAQAMLPTLKKLAIIFGTELANDSLLVVATLDQPPTGNFHPLQLTISRLANDQHESVTKIRSVWYLYDHQKISSRAYDLVFRFLAIGVIAQDPHHFDVDAEPLRF